jgi:hypothetical protein
MKVLYNTPPTLTFHFECYHWETSYFTVRDKYGVSTTKSEEIRVITHQESEVFQYYSWRDISGTFLLDTDRFLNKEFKKAYIKLHLDLVVGMNDDETRRYYNLKRVISTTETEIEILKNLVLGRQPN